MHKTTSLPLYSSQRGIWLSQELNKRLIPDTYKIAEYLDIRSPIDESQFARAFNHIFQKADSLHLQFFESDLGVQQTYKKATHYKLPFLDFSQFSKPEDQARKFMQADLESPFDKYNGPFFSFALIKLSDHRFYFYQCSHHLVNDGFGGRLLAQLILDTYDALSEQSSISDVFVGSATNFYEAENIYKNSNALKRDQAFWQEQLEGNTTAASLVTTNASISSICRLRQSLSLDLSTRLHDIAVANKVTLPQLLTTMMGIYLHKLTSNSHFRIGFPTVTRTSRLLRQSIGMGSNVLPLCFHFSENMTFSELLLDTKNNIYRLLKHQQYSEESLRADLKMHSDYEKLFATTLNIIPSQMKKPSGVVDIKIHNLAIGPTEDLIITFCDQGKHHGIELCMDANASLYSIDSLQVHMNRILHFLDSTEDYLDKQINQISILSYEERDQVLYTFNRNERDFPSALGVHELFAIQVKNTPDNIAMVSGSRKLTYKALNDMANQIAHLLCQRGIQAGDYVAIKMNRSVELIASEIAILKCGAVYVPINIDTPDARLKYLLEDCGTRFLLQTEKSNHSDIDICCIDIAEELQSHVCASEVCLPVDSNTAAYVMYTSGSTGQPKGTLVPHRAINSTVFNCNYANFTEKETVAFCSNPAFDASTGEVWGALLNGATLIVITQQQLLDSDAFEEALLTHQITVMFLSTGLFNQHVEKSAHIFRNVKCLMVGGDILDPVPIKHLLTQHPPEQFVNIYGPTEATFCSCSHQIHSIDDVTESIPVGQPISNTRVYILDDQQQPVPIGQVGELYMGGDAVALGYLNKPQLTAERFIADPFSDDANARMYKSGDLGYWQPDGTIKLLGRVDSQVKIRGYRVELNEIAAAIQSCNDVSNATVITQQSSANSNKQLVAYYVGQAEGRAIKAEISKILPDYMMPVAYVNMVSIPLTANGKVDRKALPAPTDEAFVKEVYEAPQDQLERALAKLWLALLQIEKVGRQDDFFALGGNSLLAIRFSALVRQQMQKILSIQDIFNSPVLFKQANLLRDRKTLAKTKIPTLAADTTPPLSHAQHRLWLLAKLDPTSIPAYVIPLRFHIKGSLNRQALKKALDTLVARHAPLRTHFKMIDGQPKQIVGSKDSEFPLEIVVLANADTVKTFNPMFNLTQGPLAQGQLTRIQSDEHVLQLSIHHTVADGWSISLLLEELNNLYLAFDQDQPNPLPELPVQFGDYAAWQHARLSEHDIQKQKDYWQQQLTGIPDCIALPTDRPRPDKPDYQGASIKVIIDAELTKALNNLSTQQNCTLFMTLLSSWAALLGRLTNQDDIVIGCPVAGREQVEVESLIGMFVNTLAIRIDLTAQPNSLDLLNQVRNTTLAAQANQTLPFDTVVEAIAPARDLSYSPIFQVLFALQNTSDIKARLGDLTVTELPRSVSTAQFDLSLDLKEVGNRIEGDLIYATGLFDESTIQRHLNYWLRLLAAMVQETKNPLAKLPILSQSERDELIAPCTSVTQSLTSAQCLHERFEHQVDKQPESISLKDGSTAINYQDLNRRANQLARYLIDKGIRPDSRVAIVLEHGIDLIVAILATLKSGGAYVPIDPTNPKGRLHYLLNDSQPTLILTHSSLQAVFHSSNFQQPLASCSITELDQITDRCESYSTDNIRCSDIGLSPDHLAYIIYTSGSTGQPKGVMVEHRNVTRLFDSTQGSYQFNSDDVWALAHSYAFDFSVWEIWGALSYGGQLLIVPTFIRRSPAELYQQLCEQKVTVLNQTPSAFRQLITAQANCSEKHQLRYVIFGGETLELSTLRPWFKQNRGCVTQLVNMYGITETTVHTTYYPISETDTVNTGPCPIGTPLEDLQIYLLDNHQQPVPKGVTGEIYVGGKGVSRGYFNRPELTQERFPDHPFADSVHNPGTKIYRTGDLGRWNTDGTMGYLGRNDDQVKIRGFRIELGEIETVLRDVNGITDVAVICQTSADHGSHLIAYYVGQVSKTALRQTISAQLPDYMIPSAWVNLAALPLTMNGKLDRQALPAPDASSVAKRHYEAPVSNAEQCLARLWCQLLKLDKVGRHDHFFELGGHSLLAIKLIEQLRLYGYELSVKALFTTPSLADLALSLEHKEALADSRSKGEIPDDCFEITPNMVPLTALTQKQIEHIADQVTGGSRNIQDIYPLAPLQKGMFYHHLRTEQGDPYLVRLMLGFNSKEDITCFVNALQQVINRHDILRTSIAWEGLTEPVQVVWRQATLALETLELAEIDMVKALQQRFSSNHTRLKIHNAPMMSAYCVEDKPNQRWILCLLMHHLCIDHTSLEIMLEEVQAFLSGQADQLASPIPFKEFIAQVEAQTHLSAQEAFFKSQLMDVKEPSAPFGLMDFQNQTHQLRHHTVTLDTELAMSLRDMAKLQGVSSASLFHLAWGMVVRATTGQDDVIFGTVLFGRLAGIKAANRTMGLFLNTLPLRLSLADHHVQTALQQTHQALAQLLEFEHTPLAMAQSCSQVPSQVPLFTSLLNYRYDGGSEQLKANSAPAWHQMNVLVSEEQSHYPLNISINDHHDQRFSLDLQVDTRLNCQQLTDMILQALSQIITALTTQTNVPVSQLSVLGLQEFEQLKQGFWAEPASISLPETSKMSPRSEAVDLLIAQQASANPDALAIIDTHESLTYQALNARANQIAHYLGSLDIPADAPIGLCFDRHCHLVIAMLAVFKAGLAYLPLDPALPEERLNNLIGDARPKVVLTDGVIELSTILATASTHSQVVHVLDQQAYWSALPETAPSLRHRCLEDLAYVIYTSGSTGKPKGVMVTQANLLNLVNWQITSFDLGPGTQTSSLAGLGFDACVWEIWPSLCAGATLRMPDLATSANPEALLNWWQQQPLDIGFLPTPLATLAWQTYPPHPTLRTLLVGGDKLTCRPNSESAFQVVNNYGPTEATVVATSGIVDSTDGLLHIGRPIAGTSVYILDNQGQLLPAGVVGEIYLGGASVAKGYLNQPELTAERFVADPFSPQPNARMYRTGDLGRWRADGTIEYLGRNDDQIQIRGFRIEPAEIIGCLMHCSGVDEVQIVLLPNDHDERPLIAYYRGSAQADSLHSHAKAHLPHFMVPAAYVRLDHFPLTANGKLDRDALPYPPAQSFTTTDYEPPITEIEDTLAHGWMNLLGVARAGRHDSFFNLGGHSLLAMKLQAFIDSRFNVHLSLSEIFANATLSEMAQQISIAQLKTLNPELLNSLALEAGYDLEELDDLLT